MSKLSNQDIQELLEKGILDEETIAQLRKEGKIQDDMPETVTVTMYAADGEPVRPALYFKGSQGHPYSQEMIKLKKEVNALFLKYEEEDIQEEQDEMPEKAEESGESVDPDTVSSTLGQHFNPGTNEL